MAKTLAAPRTSKTPGRQLTSRRPGLVAADEAVEQNRTGLRLPAVGRLSLPPIDHLVWYGGVAVLTTVELIEWPLALVLTVGKLLADSRSHRTLRAFGEALEHAV